jgi:GntR family transcriptional regulator/MocR family aminotransferase
MKDLLLELPKSRLPKYRKLADAIRAAIRRGRLKPGEVLPSSRELARLLGFNRHTVMTALQELEAEGWVEAREKQHYEVTRTLPDTFLHPGQATQPQARRQLEWELARDPGVPDYAAAPRARHAFPSGFPDPRLFPLREFKSHIYDSLGSRKILEYGDPRGEPRLLGEIATYLRRLRGIENREVVVTNGSQEAIFFLAQLLIEPGAVVAVEELGYPPALAALRFAGARLEPVRVDREGIVVEDLARLAKKKRVRLLYLTPLHQYPTTVTLSAARRLELYELAQREGIAILEDDYDHEFHYRSQPVAPLASFDPAGLIFYVSTFSKVLFPSARLGFMAVPPAVAKKAARLKRISSRQNEPLLQEAIGRWMASGGFERHLRRMRRAYSERLDGMLAGLAEAREQHPNLSWTVPDGGMALWLDVGRHAPTVASRALKQGVHVYSENHYRLDGKPGTHLRLGFSGQTPTENLAGLRALFAAL